MKQFKNKGNIVIALTAFIMLAALIAAAWWIKYAEDNNKVMEVYSQYAEEKLEIGDELEISKLFSLDLSNGKYTIKVFSIGAQGEEKEITLTTKYFDQNGNEVDKDTAVAMKDGKEELKEGYSKKEYIAAVGTYKIVVDKSGSEYVRTIVIKDTTPPELTLKEVEINEGTAVNISDFIQSCSDNSGGECTFYFADETGKEITEIPTAVGEYTIRIAAKDSAGNISGTQETKLTINQVIVPQNTDTAAGSSSSTKSTSSSKSTSPGSSSSSGNSSGNSANSAPAANTNGYDTSNPIVKEALSLVGQKMVCTDVAQACLQTVGKSLWVNEVVGYRNTINGDSVSADTDIYGTQTFTYNITNYDGSTTYYVSETVTSYNNMVTNIEIANVSPPNANITPDTYMIGRAVFKPSTMTVYTEANIKQIAAQIPLSSIKPGDFLFYERGSRPTTHIAVYIGNNQTVDGGWTNGYVAIVNGIYLAGRPDPTAWRVSY